MNLETRAKITKFITDLIAFSKIVLSFFLVIVVIAWLMQFFEFEHNISFINSINDFLIRFSSVFYTPTKDDEESFNALLYMSIALVFFLLIFETTTEILDDVLKLHERHQESIIDEENKKINQKINQNYKKHLLTAFNFTILLKLKINNPLNSTRAFQDEKLEQSILKEEQQILKDIYTIITTSIKHPIQASPEMIIIDIPNPDELNKTLNFIFSVCNVEKYIKYGIEYYASVTPHAKNEPATTAIEDGIKILELKNTRKILCHQVVCECLNLVKNCHFRFENNGTYSTDENDNIFELINKN